MGINVLVVDDSGVMRSMIIKILGMTGLPIGEVYQAGNGQEGLEMLDHNRIDLVIADINMPVMNGEEMIGRMRENPDTGGTPVVVVSTEGNMTRIERLKDKGAVFIRKPFTPEIIRDAIKVVLKPGGSDENTA